MLTACCYYVKDDFFRKEILKNNYIDVIFEMFSKYLVNEDKEIYRRSIELLKKDF